MYIHEQSDWPGFTWDKTRVDEKLKSIYLAAGYLRGRLSLIGLEDQMTTVAEALSREVLGSSEIEGVELNTDQVRSSVARKLGVHIPHEKPSTHYIDGIVEMTYDAQVRYDAPLTKERLFGWHNCLFPTGWSGNVHIDVARYRTTTMKVVSGIMGREKVHYEAPSPERLEKEMSLFLDWFNSDRDKGVIKSALAHFWFVSIHPFDDGNGRIGRAIADMALSRFEGSGRRFYSISEQIKKEKKGYYQALEHAQKGTCDLTEWLMWYLDTILHAIKRSKDILSKVLNKAFFWQTHAQTTISERQKLVLNRFWDGWRAKLTVKNWAKAADVSADTAARDIKDLVSKGVLVPQKTTVRDVFYGIRYRDQEVFVPLPEENHDA